MNGFLTEDFLLSNDAGRHLYRRFAEPQPIFDYQCHLPPRDIAENRRFANLFEIWLEGDHYKWRAMRANGVDEKYCTGDAAPYEKFLAWARTVPYTLRNPLYLWTHLELQRYFGITELLNVTTAPAIWKRANIALQDGLSVREILRKFRVSTLCTTDDPVDDLNAHLRIRETSTIRTLNGLQRKEGETDVRPTFRPDRALQIDDPASFLPWLDKLRAASNIDICNLATLLDALRQRHDYFGEVGCRASDHGLARCYANPCGEETAA